MTEVPPPRDTDDPPSRTPPPDRGKRPGIPAEADPLARFDGRILDPATAVRVAGRPLPKPTVYRNNRLLINSADAGELRAIVRVIDSVLDEMSRSPNDNGPASPRYAPRNFDPVSLTRQLTPAFPTADIPTGERQDFDPPAPGANDPEETEPEWRDQTLRLQRAEREGLRLAAVILLEPRPNGLSLPSSPVDAFEVMTRLRAHNRQDIRKLGRKVGLEHLLFVSANLAPFGASLAPFGASLAPFGASLAPFGASLQAGIPLNRSAAGGLLSYLAPGTGGRTPVSLVVDLPAVALDGSRAVVLDTGCDDTHPWFSEKNPDERVVRRVEVRGNGAQTIGVDVLLQASIDTDPEGNACAPDALTGAVSPCCGHGTFITGILRQRAPSAQIVSLRIADADGVVPEGALAAAVTEVAIKQRQEPGWTDVLVLSLGYYPEEEMDPEDPDSLEHSALAEQLLQLSELGVAVFAAAGNDSTSRQFFPAAFALDPRFANGISLVSVAARNPDGTIALFSNDGDWVTADAPGANLVSAFPTRMAGAWQPDVSLRDTAGRQRATIDPDQFSGGFGLWSGTSFAAPVLAGDYLCELIKERSALKAKAASADPPPDVSIKSRHELIAKLLRAK